MTVICTSCPTVYGTGVQLSVAAYALDDCRKVVDSRPFISMWMDLVRVAASWDCCEYSLHWGETQEISALVWWELEMDDWGRGR